MLVTVAALVLLGLVGSFEIGAFGSVTLKRVLRSGPALALLLLPACATLGLQQGGLNLVSVDQEWGMRDDLRSEVEQQYQVVHDPDALAYLNRVGRRLSARTPFADRAWDFGIVRDDSINAFNLPGGLVYVHTGLIRRAEALDQLAGVLAHEVGHGAARHGTQMMTRAWGVNVVASLVLGNDPGLKRRLLAQLVGTGLLRNYSRDAETEADRLGVRYAYEAGYDPRGIPEFFRILIAERQRRPSALEQFFASHPVTEDRIRRTEAEIATLPDVRLVRDSHDFQVFRGRFR